MNTRKKHLLISIGLLVLVLTFYVVIDSLFNFPRSFKIENQNGIFLLIDPATLNKEIVSLPRLIIHSTSFILCLLSALYSVGSIVVFIFEKLSKRAYKLF